MDYDELQELINNFSSIKTDLTQLPEVQPKQNSLRVLNRIENNLNLMGEDIEDNDFTTEVSAGAQKMLPSLLSQFITSLMVMNSVIAEPQQNGFFTHCENIHKAITNMATKLPDSHLNETLEGFDNFIKYNKPEIAEEREEDSVGSIYSEEEDRALPSGGIINAGDDENDIRNNFSREGHYVPEEREFDDIVLDSDIATLSKEGSPEFTALKNTVNNKSATDLDLFNVSWRYLSMKDTKPWHTEGQKRVDSAARVMAQAALNILSKADELPKGFIQNVQAEAMRNEAFRRTMLEQLPNVADNPVHGQLAGNLYGEMLIADLICQVREEKSLSHGKMVPDKNGVCGRFTDAVNKMNEFQILVNKLKSKTNDPIETMNNVYDNLSEKINVKKMEIKMPVKKISQISKKLDSSIISI